ncbi:GNAT family N-acetyltransferase [Paractinoplanes ferrugineus]|nr:GNAT family N-acetyltransferase [Actinoplanes ferrugineus]
MAVTALRAMIDTDLDPLFAMMRDPESMRMAAFVGRDPDNRELFEAHLSRLRANPEVTYRVITQDGAVAGMISSWVTDGETEITYWVDRAFWGQGIASAALTLFLQVVRSRPIHARAAADNRGSLRVLEKAGFKQVNTEISYAEGRHAEIEEAVLILS